MSGTDRRDCSKACKVGGGGEREVGKGEGEGERRGRGVERR